MKKNLRVIIYGTPVLLFLLATINNFATSNEGMNEVYGVDFVNGSMFFGTLFSPVFVFILLTFLGITFINSNKEFTQSIGKTLYSTSFVSIVLLYKSLKQYFVRIDVEFDLAIGGWLFVAAIITGLLVVLSFFVIPIIEELREKKALVNLYEDDDEAVI